MTTLTFTHTIYQEGPLAQALTAFQENQKKARISYEESKRQIEAEEAANKEKLIEKAKERFGTLWHIMSPYIVKSYLTWEKEIIIHFQMPEVSPFQLTQQLDGYARIEFPFTTLDNTFFDARHPVTESEFARALALGHQDWLKKQADYQAAKERYAQKLAYADAFCEYEREYESTLARNQMGLALLQEEYTTTFPVWRLTYGITAYNDDQGEFYADTRGVWVLSPDPDEDGFFAVIEDTGHVIPRKYYSLVCLEGPETFDAAPGSIFCGHIYIKEADDTLYFSPLLKYAEVLTRVRSWVEANMSWLPEPPHPTAFGLDEQPSKYEMDNLNEELNRLVGEDEIPF